MADDGDHPLSARLEPAQIRPAADRASEEGKAQVSRLITKDGRICGWLARFGDTGINRPGSEDAHLIMRFDPKCEWIFPKALPMMFGHDPDAIVGLWDWADVRPGGVWVEGTVINENIRDLLRAGAINGLSHGARRMAWVSDEFALTTTITKIELREISIVDSPKMNRSRLMDVRNMRRAR